MYKLKKFKCNIDIQTEISIIEYGNICSNIYFLDHVNY